MDIAGIRGDRRFPVAFDDTEGSLHAIKYRDIGLSLEAHGKRCVTFVKMRFSCACRNL